MPVLGSPADSSHFLKKLNTTSPSKPSLSRACRVQQRNSHHLRHKAITFILFSKKSSVRRILKLNTDPRRTGDPFSSIEKENKFAVSYVVGVEGFEIASNANGSKVATGNEKKI
jgi:hypothetical protein